MSIEFLDDVEQIQVYPGGNPIKTRGGGGGVDKSERAQEPISTKIQNKKIERHFFMQGLDISWNL
jgi:hypothetical protein